MGPAIIERSNILINDKEYKDSLSVFNVLQNTLPSDANWGLSLNLVVVEVIPPREEIIILKVNSIRFEDDQKIATKLGLDLDLCYCSIHNDCKKIGEKYNVFHPTCY